jgi:hypothetical protein
VFPAAASWCTYERVLGPRMIVHDLHSNSNTLVSNRVVPGSFSDVDGTDVVNQGKGQNSTEGSLL